MQEIIYKAVLHNAIKYEGKPNAKAVLGLLLAQHPELRKDVKELQVQINDAVAKISKLSAEELAKEEQKIGPFEEKKREEQRLKDLPNAQQGNVVMRIAPSPSGPLHIGHGYVLGLSHALTKKYQGKLLLRLEDTNPENLYPPAYELIPEDAQWLTNNSIAETIIQSDRLKNYYDYAEKLVAKGHAYVCTCSADEFREKSSKMQPCPCRELDTKEQLSRWDKMFIEYKPGEAVLRIKTDIQHKNPAMRDWPAMRINDHEHPRQKTMYRVWPLMNFAVACDDHDMGITHTIRGKDHKDNEQKQKYIFDYFNWQMPTHVYVGRINFVGFELSTSETRKKIEYGAYSGWDDIRLPFFQALKKRGYQPEAFQELAIDLGLTEADKTLATEEYFKLLDAHNKQCIEKQANRYFALQNAQEIVVEGAPETIAELDLHPEHRKGGRIFKVQQHVLLEKKDLDKCREKDILRLMDAYNIQKTATGWKYHSKSYEDYKKVQGKGIVHYLPKEHKAIPITILEPTGEQKEALAEEGIAQVKEGQIIQLERYAFVRLEDKRKQLFYYTHK